nr:PHD finger protein 14-like [Lepeophtheirus salmonis]
MEFLFKSRSQGKRQIKPSQDIQYLEDTYAQESSEDSDFKIDTDHEDLDEERTSDSDSGDEEEDDELEEELANAKGVREMRLTTSDLLGISKQETCFPGDEDALLFKFKVCACCLGTSSNDANEIVECDGCGISVHETCYGITESGSVASNISEASTEPWFCDPCQAGITTSPICELCPAIGGVYKETDVGRWVHLICALYVNGVAFGDIDKLSAITIFEINYSNWGRKACGLCEQSPFSRTGICIQCDAGMCRSSFHASCGQAHGLLAEPVYTETDPYIAHCRLHSDKSVIKSKKRLYAISKRQAERRKSLILESREGQNISSTSSLALPNETPAQRILRKLNRRQSRFHSSKKNELPLPFKKTPRFLSSSASAIRKTQRLTECVTGLSSDRQKAKEAQYMAIQEIQKKWNLTPSFNVEFVAYFHDRQSRLLNLKTMLSEEMKSASLLRTRQSQIQQLYEKANEERDAHMKINSSLTENIQFYTITLTAMGMTIPPEHSILPRSQVEGVSNGNEVHASKQSSYIDSVSGRVGNSSELLNLSKCGVCLGINDQHLIIPCDTCILHYHLGCLNPPLTRMLKRSKLYKWQCSECDKLSSGDVGNQVDVSRPRRHRYKKTSFNQGGGNFSSEEDGPMEIDFNKSFSDVVEEKKVVNGSSHLLPVENPEVVAASLVSAKAEKKRLKKERKREKKKRKMQKLVPSIVAGGYSSDEVEVLKGENNQSASTNTTPLEIKHHKPIKIKIRNIYENKTIPVAEPDHPLLPKNNKKKRLSADAKDVRTFCNKCEASGSNSNLVRCDECQKCYHFSCLFPPVKKTPKVAGYGWHCNECDPSDVDSDWHLD